MDYEAEINSKPYPIAVDRNGTLWQVTDIGRELEEVWDDWSLGMGEASRGTRRGYYFATGFDASTIGLLRLSPNYIADNNTSLTENYGYFAEEEGASATVAFVSTSSGTGTSSKTNTVSHTVAAGIDRLLVVGVSSVSVGISVTWGGVALTLLANNSNLGAKVQIWYLVNPAVGTQDVVVTLLASTNSVVGVENFTGVRQGEPFGAVVSATGESTAVTATVTTQSGEMVIDVIAADANVTGSAGANQTERWDSNVSTNITGIGSTQAGSDGGVMSYTLSGSAKWVTIAAPIKQGPAPWYFILDTTKIYQYKYDTSALTLNATDTTASGVAGQPVKVGGDWYVPMGSGANAQKLSDADNNTWGDVTGTWKADHLSTFQKGVTPTVARVNATTQNTVELNDDVSDIADTWTNESAAVGDASTKVTHLVEAQGELLVAKEDGLYRFDQEATSYPVIPFLNRGAINPDNGKGTTAFGDIILYPSNEGEWRYRIGGGAIPTGVNSIRTNRRVPGDTLLTGFKDRHEAYEVHVGEWVYTLLNNDIRSTVIAKRPRREGDPAGHEWIQHSILDIPLSKGMYVDSRMRLWLKGASPAIADRDVRAIQLNRADGSPDVLNYRGQADEDHDIYLDEADFGLPDKLKQFREVIVQMENIPSNVTLDMRVSRDSASEETLSSATPTTFTSSNWTVGATDTGYQLRLHLRLTTGASYDPINSDLAIRRITVKARSEERLRVVIPSDDGALDGYGLTAKDALKNLRRLQNQGVVTMREPGSTSTFSGEVLSVTNTLYETEKGHAQGIELTIRRFGTD